MPVEEFSRLYYAMGRVLEDATAKLGLSKKTGIVLWLLSQGDAQGIENRDLVNRFSAWHVSKTPQGASRDVSLANAELDRKGLITIRRNPYRICLSALGTDVSRQLSSALKQATATIDVLPEQRELLTTLVVGRTPRRPIGREQSAAPRASRRTANRE